MPAIIPYAQVLERLTGEGLVSLYHNAGAFGFAPEATVHAVGWIGEVDPTLRPEALQWAHVIAPPLEPNLARLCCAAWERLLRRNVWLMPKSHWAYELDFGNRELLERELAAAGVDPAELHPLNNAAAIEFSTAEPDVLRRLVEQMLMELRGSDFLLAFPGHAAVCTIHHHKQLWWQTRNQLVANGLVEMVRP